jgi:hypothetical protein
MRRSDSRPSISPHFVAFVWRYHPCASFAPSGRARGRGLRGVGVPVPEPEMSVETGGAPKFLGTPRVPWPCSSTPVGSVTPGHRGVPTRSPRLTRARTPPMIFRGSIARPGHWLSTLRSGSRLPPRKTRFRLLAKLCRTGFVHPQGSNERFLSSSLVLPSQASWRNVSSYFRPKREVGSSPIGTLLRNFTGRLEVIDLKEGGVDLFLFAQRINDRTLRL